MSKNIDLNDFKKIEMKIEYEDIAKEYAEKCKVKIQNKSPRGSRGRYASGWSVREEKFKNEYGSIVYNKTDWQLTHLLENGHIIANKKDGTGWASAKPHINPAYRSVRNKFIKAIQNATIKVDGK